MKSPPPSAAQDLGGLKIIVDAFNADLKQGSGVATYTRTLISALQALGGETAMLYTRRAPPSARDPLVAEVSFHSAEEPPREGRLAQLAQKASLAAAALYPFARMAHEVPRRDVVLTGGEGLAGRAYNAPHLADIAEMRDKLTGHFAKVQLADKFDVAHLTYPWPVHVSAPRRVVTIHDLIPLRLPYATLDNKRDYVRRLRTTCATADLLITVSESSKRDMIEILGAPADKIAVTYQSADLQPLEDEERARHGAVLARYGLEAGNYALFVGAIEPKKNLKRLLRAYLETDLDEPLAVVGRRAWLWRGEVEEARSWKARNGASPILFLDYAPRDDLRYLYSGARALLFPSLYEGFGLPCLEAMRLGVPVLTSTTSSLPEVCGEAALYVNPFDGRDLQAKIKALMSDAALRHELSAAGLIQAQKFTAERYRERLLEAYRRLR